MHQSPGNCDGFLVRLDPGRIPEEQLGYSTLLGGTSHDRIRALALDGDCTAIVSGFTYSPGLEATPGVVQEAFGGGDVDIFIAKFDGLCVDEPTCFIRGDTNASRAVDIADSVYLLNSLFLDGGALPCTASADTNGDGKVDVSDAVVILSFLFLGGPEPVTPFPECGHGALPGDEELGCDRPLPAGG